MTTTMQADEQRRQDAVLVMGAAFCRLRLWARYELTDEGRKHMEEVADAAHNIPDALTGNEIQNEHVDLEIARLKQMVMTAPAPDIYQRHFVQEVRKIYPTGLCEKNIVAARIAVAAGVVLFVFGTLLGKFVL